MKTEKKCKECGVIKKLNENSTCSTCESSSPFLKTLISGLIILIAYAALMTLGIEFRHEIGALEDKLVSITPQYVKTFLWIMLIGAIPMFFLCIGYSKLTEES